MSQYPVRSGPIQNDAAPFTPEMVAGYHPDRNRAFPPKNQGWTDSQPTFISQMTVEMFGGYHPDSPRLFLKPQLGWQSSQTSFDAAPFTPDMVTGWHSDKPRLPFVAKPGWQDTQHTFLVVMTPEMFAGWHPDKPRIVLGPRIPLPIDQAASHVSAPFSQEMIAGWHPDKGYHYVPQLGWIWFPNETIVQVFLAAWATNCNVVIIVPQPSQIER